MASLCCSAPLSQFNLGFRRLTCSPNRSSINVLTLQHNLLPASSILRYKYCVKFQLSQRFVNVFPSNATRSKGDAITEDSNKAKSGDVTSKGPPH